MAGSSNFSIVGMKSHSTNRPPLFDGTNYQFWSKRMSIYMRSCDYKIWKVFMDDPNVPTKIKRESGELEPKLRSEWMEAKTKRYK